MITMKKKVSEYSVMSNPPSNYVIEREIEGIAMPDSFSRPNEYDLTRMALLSREFIHNAFGQNDYAAKEYRQGYFVPVELKNGDKYLVFMSAAQIIDQRNPYNYLLNNCLGSGGSRNNLGRNNGAKKSPTNVFSDANHSDFESIFASRIPGEDWKEKSSYHIARQKKDPMTKTFFNQINCDPKEINEKYRTIRVYEGGNYPLCDKMDNFQEILDIISEIRLGQRYKEEDYNRNLSYDFEETNIIRAVRIPDFKFTRSYYKSLGIFVNVSDDKSIGTENYFRIDGIEGFARLNKDGTSPILTEAKVSSIEDMITGKCYTNSESCDINKSIPFSNCILDHNKNVQYKISGNVKVRFKPNRMVSDGRSHTDLNISGYAIYDKTIPLYSNRLVDPIFLGRCAEGDKFMKNILRSFEEKNKDKYLDFENHTFLQIEIEKVVSYRKDADTGNIGIFLGEDNSLLFTDTDWYVKKAFANVGILSSIFYNIVNDARNQDILKEIYDFSIKKWGKEVNTNFLQFTFDNKMEQIKKFFFDATKSIGSDPIKSNNVRRSPLMLVPSVKGKSKTMKHRYMSFVLQVDGEHVNEISNLESEKIDSRHNLEIYPLSNTKQKKDAKSKYGLNINKDYLDDKYTVFVIEIPCYYRIDSSSESCPVSKDDFKKSYYVEGNSEYGPHPENYITVNSGHKIRLPLLDMIKPDKIEGEEVKKKNTAGSAKAAGNIGLSRHTRPTFVDFGSSIDGGLYCRCGSDNHVEINTRKVINKGPFFLENIRNNEKAYSFVKAFVDHFDEMCFSYRSYSLCHKASEFNKIKTFGFFKGMNNNEISIFVESPENNFNCFLNYMFGLEFEVLINNLSCVSPFKNDDFDSSMYVEEAQKIRNLFSPAN